MKTVIARSRIEVDGKVYTAGQEVSVSDDAAEYLIGAGAAVGKSATFAVPNARTEKPAYSEKK